MSSKSIDFFSIPSPNKASEKQSVITKEEKNFFDIPSQTNTWVKPEAPSISTQLKNAPELAAREAIASIKSLPSLTAESYRFIAGKLQELGQQQAAKEGREISQSETELTNKFVNAIPDLIKDLGEKFPNVFPTYQQARKQTTEELEKKYEERLVKPLVGGREEKLPEKGRGFIEKASEGIGKATPLLLSGASTGVKLAGLGTSALTEGLDVSEGKKLGLNIGVPIAFDLAKALFSKKYTPSTSLKELYDEAKSIGFSDKDLAPILASEGQIARHGKLAAGVKGTEKAFEKTGESLGKKISEIRSDASASTRLTKEAQVNLIDHFTKVRDRIKKGSHALSPENKLVFDFLDKSIADIRRNGSTPDKLIGTWREINKTKEGSTALAQLKNPIIEAISSVDPKLALKFQITNKLYSRYLTNLKEINPSQFNAFVNASKLNDLVGAVFSGDPSRLQSGILKTVAHNTLGRISSKILTDANAQSLVRNFGKAVRSGSKPASVAIANQLKEYIKKEIPDEYENIDWESLGITP